MKKAKIMLTVLAILAIVGGALAFKAHRHTTYCIVNNVTPSGAGLTTTLNCNFWTISTSINAVKLSYEIPTFGEDCNGAITCTAHKLVGD